MLAARTMTSLNWLFIFLEELFGIIIAADIYLRNSIEHSRVLAGKI